MGNSMTAEEEVAVEVVERRGRKVEGEEEEVEEGVERGGRVAEVRERGVNNGFCGEDFWFFASYS